MQLRRTLVVGVEVVAVLVVLALVGGSLLGQPVLLSFVETGSMEPTMDPGDGFIAVPQELAGDVSEGDVVVFEAEEIQGGGLTTHRVVGETERGFVTQGDANPFTDQDGGEPYVQEAEVLATAFTLGDEVVVIPHLGTGVMAFQSAVDSAQRWMAITFGTRAFLGTQGLAYVLFGLSVVAYVVDWYLTGGGPDRERSVDRDDGTSVRTILLGLAAVLVLTATVAMVAPAGTQSYGVVSAEFDSENPTVIQQGESETLPYTVPNAGLVPVHVYVTPASDGVATEPEHVYLGPRDEATVDLTLTAPDETGYYQRFAEERRYLAVLPAPVIHALHDFHPWAPIVAVNATLGGGIYLLGLLLIGSGKTRIRSRDRPTSGASLRSLLRSLYP